MTDNYSTLLSIALCIIVVIGFLFADGKINRLVAWYNKRNKNKE